MTWTEGTLQISETITIYGGYWGIISFSAFILLMLAFTIFFSLAIGKLLSDTLKEMED